MNRRRPAAVPKHVERRRQVERLPVPLRRRRMRADRDPRLPQPRLGRLQRRPLPARCHRHRRQRRTIRPPEHKLPIRARDHLKPLLVHRPVVVATHENQVGKSRRPAVRPVHDVMRVAVAELTAGELTLMVVSDLQRAAQRSRHRARSAPDLQDCAVGSVRHQHAAGVAGDAAGCGRSEVNAIRLFDDRRAVGGGGVGCRRRCHRRRGDERRGAQGRRRRER